MSFLTEVRSHVPARKNEPTTQLPRHVVTWCDTHGHVAVKRDGVWRCEYCTLWPK
jgi:hypothetical protein